MKKLIFTFLFVTLTCVLLAQVKVIFKIVKLPAEPALPKTIYLSGSFNDWRPADSNWRLTPNPDGQYSRTFTLPAGTYEFKVTRGSWLESECAINGSSSDNRRFRILKDTVIAITIMEWKDNFPAEVKKHTASEQVHVMAEKFMIPQLGRERKVWIYLPKDYKTSHKVYPVIYMHDGQNLFDEATANSGEWGVDDFLDQLGADKQTAVVVGIDNGGEHRMTEYNPYDSNFGKGEGLAYAQFLAETLKPYIDAHYRTRRSPQYTTVAGSSMGGLISMYAALTYPNIFGNAGVFSPSFWIAPQLYDYAVKHAVENSRYYFVCGDQESEKEADQMNKMVTLLKQMGFPPQSIPSTVVKGARHDEKQWRGDFPDFYKWLMNLK